MHADDIDEIDETNTQLSGRSGSWLCLPAPPSVVHGGHALNLPHAQRAGSITGSMHISASMNLGAEMDRQSTTSCGASSGWFVAFGGNGCSRHDNILQIKGQMPRNGSIASQSEIAV
jgi:hypothetical protein